MVQSWQGAEALVQQHGNKIIKKRIVKQYRHASLDRALRSSRTKRESKILSHLQKLNFPSPKLQEERETTLTMEYIPGKRLVDTFHTKPVNYAKELGILIGKLHSLNITHGDLTTSNMIVHPKKGLYFIDFGLSSFSGHEEDKAVDIHVLDKALEAKHHKHYPKSMQIVTKHYLIAYPQGKAVIERLRTVSSRGRHQQKNKNINKHK